MLYELSDSNQSQVQILDSISQTWLFEQKQKLKQLIEQERGVEGAFILHKEDSGH